MPLKKGKSHQIISGNIRELVSAGHEPKQAVAMALSHSRKYSEGGMVGEEENEQQDGEMSTPAERQTEAQFENEVSNPEEIEEHHRFAEALKKQAHQMSPESFAMGGLVESDSENKPSESMESSSEEPMSSMAKKPDEMSLPEDAQQALEERKKNRRYAR